MTKLTKEAEAIITELGTKRINKTIAREIKEQLGQDVTLEQIQAYKDKHDLRLKRYPRRMFYDHHIEFIYKHYKGKTTAKLTEMLNEEFNSSFTPDQVRNFKERHKLRSGVVTQFQKGNIPWTKGVPAKERYSKEEYKKFVARQFKKGHNTVKVIDRGTLVKDNSFDYIKVKIADRPSLWVYMHVLVWESAHGPIPEDHQIFFLDGNRQNCSLDNLRIAKKSAILRMNQRGLYIPEDPELNEVALTVSEVIAKTDEIKRQKRERKNNGTKDE